MKINNAYIDTKRSSFTVYGVVLDNNDNNKKKFLKLTYQGFPC